MVKKVIRIVALIICLAIIVYEGVMIYVDQKEYQVASDEYDEIRSVAVDYIPEDEAEIVDYPVLNINFGKLEEINPDVTAWIYFPCLEISYPVVKESEVDEYLYKTFELEKNKAGCIFEDVMSDAGFNGYHDIVFGHNMKDKSMFGRLKDLYQKGNESLLEDDPYIYIYTKDHVYQYRVFAYYITKVGSGAYSVVSNLDEYKDFISFIQTHSAYKIPSDLDLESGNSILTLSTCSGRAGGSQRFVVHSLKVNGWEK